MKNYSLNFYVILNWVLLCITLLFKLKKQLIENCFRAQENHSIIVQIALQEITVSLLYFSNPITNIFKKYTKKTYYNPYLVTRHDGCNSVTTKYVSYSKNFVLHL